MKKIVSIFLSLIIFTTLTSCITKMSIDDAIIQIEKDLKKNLENDYLVDDFYLPSTFNRFTLSWYSSDKEKLEILPNLSEKVKVHQKKEIQNVILTLNINDDLDSRSKDFNLKIGKLAEYELKITYYDGNRELYSISFNYNDIPTSPTAPKKEGFIFEGWYFDNNFTKKYEFNLKLTESIFLYARFISNDSSIDTKLELDLKMLESYNFNISKEKLDLPLKGNNGSTISWVSSNPKIISNNGFIFSGEIQENVTFTATLKLGSVKKTFIKKFWVDKFSRSTNLNFSKKKLSFENLETDYNIAKSAKISTYFLDGGNLAYIDIEDFFNSLSGFFVKNNKINIKYDNNIATISYTRNGLKETAKINFILNTLEAPSYLFFDNYNVDTYDDYPYDGIDEITLNKLPGNNIFFNFNKYNINTFVYNDNEFNKKKYLIPFHFANLIFTGSSYYNVYYNGDKYYGFVETPDSYMKNIKNSSFTNKNISNDIIYNNYNFMAFLFDNYYGLIDPNNKIDSYYDVLLAYQDRLLTSNPNNLSQNISDFLLEIIDDPHSSYAYTGYYNDQSFEVNYNGTFGNRLNAFYEYIYDIEYITGKRYNLLKGEELDKNKINNLTKHYQFLDNKTAIIFLYEFLMDNYSQDYYSSKEILEKSITKIFQEKPNTQKIILDLSINGGGQFGAVFDVLAFMSATKIKHSSYNPISSSRIDYLTNSTLNQIDPSILEKSRNASWYILTSIGTYSSANAVAAIAKNHNFAKIIGEKSGGGASSIQPIILVDGSIIYISSLDVLTLLDGSQNMIDIEYGVDPDIIIPFEKFNDNPYILNKIYN